MNPLIGTPYQASRGVSEYVYFHWRHAIGNYIYIRTEIGSGEQSNYIHDESCVMVKVETIFCWGDISLFSTLSHWFHLQVHKVYRLYFCRICLENNVYSSHRKVKQECWIGKTAKDLNTGSKLTCLFHVKSGHIQHQSFITWQGDTVAEHLGARI